MAAHKYVTKGYSTYTNIPSRYGGYDHGSKNPVNRYVIETTTVERVHTPATRYTNHVGSPSKIELLKEYVHDPGVLTETKYAPKDHYEGYEPNYRLDYEHSNSPRYHGRDDLTDNFFDKVQIEASRPRKSSHLSSPNKHRHSSPVHEHVPEEAHLIRSGGFSSPDKYHPSSPNSERARHARPGNFRGQNNSWQSVGPDKYHVSSPGLEGDRHARAGNFPDQNNSWHSVGPDRYHVSSPGLKGDRHARGGNFPDQNNSWQSVGPDKYHVSSPRLEGDRHARAGNFPGQNNSWLSAGPPVTRHPLTTPTNDINEALGFLQEAVNHSPRLGQRRRGVLDGLSTRAQPIEPERRHVIPTSVGGTIQPHYKNTMSENEIDSHEAMRKYGGSLVL